jgi:hypothetical protein
VQVDLGACDLQLYGADLRDIETGQAGNTEGVADRDSSAVSIPNVQLSTHGGDGDTVQASTAKIDTGSAVSARHSTKYNCLGLISTCAFQFALVTAQPPAQRHRSLPSVSSFVGFQLCIRRL